MHQQYVVSTLPVPIAAYHPWFQGKESTILCREAEAASLGLDTSKQTEDALSVHAPLAVAAWKGKGSINILVSKGTFFAPSMSLCVFATLLPMSAMLRYIEG